MSAANREASIAKTIDDYEGGYTNNAEDDGGPTNWGITIADARHYWKPDATATDVKNMPKSVAVEIYRQRYWGPCGCDDLPAGLDFAVFDFGVNSGPARALRYLAVTKGTTVERIEQLCDARLQFMQQAKNKEGHLLWPTFGKGWAKRVADVRATAKRMASVIAVPIPPPPDIPKPEPAPPTQQNPLVALLIAIFKAFTRGK